MRALFLADAHLRNPDDFNYRTLISFLDAQRGQIGTLVLLGDIFEFWIGKESAYPDHQPMIDCLDRLQQDGTRLVYVEGNHDFHLGPIFSQRQNCQILPDGGSIELDGKKVFLAHGDMANPADTGYRRLRKFLRSGLIKFLIRTVPTIVTMSIAKRGSSHSRKSGSEKRDKKPVLAIIRSFAKQCLASGHQAVVTGHFHLPLHEKLGDGELIALGDWISQFSYAVYEDGVFDLKNYSPEA